MQSGIHPDWTLADSLAWFRAKTTGRAAGGDLHLHAYAPMEIAHMCDISGLPPSEVFNPLYEAGLGWTPGSAAERLHDRVRISRHKLPGARWVEMIEVASRRGRTGEGRTLE